ncbi:membrane protein insertion efficiency factor YidD [Bosea sp. (in: a-proteobacteria)]|uniref:membrane protein insertion efficiency factor YidD n=1 Tax=Bosea sp. (in: a-proteobacteria) TaxID=1871050 RepID=UPI0025B8F34E|nr:membrane protein insertion efficiency factor YidD [Bosea sp. (in: a-proteobacteria)]
MASQQRLSRLFAQAAPVRLAPRRAAHWAIRGYQLSLSLLIGRHCRHWPSCSAYTDEAIQRFGLWRGGWIGVARICRCTPLGTSGIDLVCEELPPDAAWYRPWSYGRWRGVNAPPAEPDAEAGADGAAVSAGPGPAAGRSGSPATDRPPSP